MIEGFIYDYGTEKERSASRQEAIQILKEIHHEFVKNNGAIQYPHKVTHFFPHSHDVM
jgi:hypothetical protein